MKGDYVRAAAALAAIAAAPRVLILAGPLNAAIHPPGHAGYAAGGTQPPDWHALVAWDMLFNNMTTGLFLVAAAGDFAAPGSSRRRARAYPSPCCF